MKHLLAIGFIWFGCALAWVILGSTILFRTGETSTNLSSEVRMLWGPNLAQSPPGAVYKTTAREPVTVPSSNGTGSTTTWRTRTVSHPLPLTKSELDVSLSLRHRRKGLMWFPTYEVDFKGAYQIENTSETSQQVTVTFPLYGSTYDKSRNKWTRSSSYGGVNDATVYDGFQVKSAKGEDLHPNIRSNLATWTVTLGPGESQAFVVSYRSRGTSVWTYNLTEGGVQVHNFNLKLNTNFPNIDFPAGSLSPTKHQGSPGTWTGTWTFDSLVSNATIGVKLPQRLNPGPLASKITFFAPVSLLFFFFVVAVLAAAKKQHIHPLNYFFFGCAFFAFHLLFAYLVDQLAIVPSFAIASAVSIALVISYARLFVPWRFALVDMAIAQVLYLVLFSVTFFWSGFTGLAITIGAIVTLFVMMQVTGRINWRDRFVAAEG